MILVIPAYEPSEKLLLLLREMNDQDNCHIILVDDGSGSAFDSIFRASEKMGCTVLRYDKNKGKGYALRYAFAYISKSLPKDIIVCADCDGQHAPKDILRVADKTMKSDKRQATCTRLAEIYPSRAFSQSFREQNDLLFFSPCNWHTHKRHPDRPARHTL